MQLRQLRKNRINVTTHGSAHIHAFGKGISGLAWVGHPPIFAMPPHGSVVSNSMRTNTYCGLLAIQGLLVLLHHCLQACKLVSMLVGHLRNRGSRWAPHGARPAGFDWLIGDAAASRPRYKFGDCSQHVRDIEPSESVDVRPFDALLRLSHVLYFVHARQRHDGPRSSLLAATPVMRRGASQPSTAMNDMPIRIQPFIFKTYS